MPKYNRRPKTEEAYNYEQLVEYSKGATTFNLGNWVIEKKDACFKLTRYTGSSEITANFYPDQVLVVINDNYFNRVDRTWFDSRFELSHET